MKTKPDDPAFGSTALIHQNGNVIGTSAGGGLTKIEWFTGMAMHALISTLSIGREENTPFIVEAAKNYAHAQIEELNKDD